MSLTAILAISDDGIIGVDGLYGPTLPWRIPSDLKRFRSLTTGHAIIMGRKTFDSIGKPLPDRVNVVVSRRPRPETLSSIHGWSSEPELAYAAALLADTNPFLIGGGELYAALWRYVTRVELTEVHTTVGSGTRFSFDRTPWVVTAREGGLHEELRYEFVTLEKK